MSEKNKHENEEQPQIKPEDKIPLLQKIAYSMGVVSDHYANVCLAWIFLTPFFVDFLGLGATVVGLALGAARCWDAFTDPLVGRISDRTKSRFGRRKPYIFVGAILTGLMFPLIWLVPESWSTAAITAYLFVALMIFFSVYSIFSVPYEALGAELTPDYSERSWIFIVRKYVQELFNLGIVWVFPLAMWLGKRVGGEINGVRSISWVIGGVIIVAGILPAIFNKERYKDIATKEGSGSFKEGLTALIRNKPLLIVIGVIATYLFAIMATANLAYFVNVYYIYEGDVVKGAALGGIDGTLRLGFALTTAWVIGLIGNRVDKHKIMLASCAILLVAFVGMYFTTITGRPWLALSMKPLVAIGECGFWVLILSMRADVCDWDEYKTGTRSEGLIAAIANWCNKIAMTLAIVISGWNLEHIVKFDSKLDEAVKTEIVAQAEAEYAEMTEAEKLEAGGGEKPISLEVYTDILERKKVMENLEPGTMKRLRIFYSLPQAGALILCLIMLSRYPLTRKKMEEIRAELEARRGVAAVE
ncbi:MFS transporter [Verrucomicrobia bacterium S94]|nr:MFS transporter [Verrucomicrobia bacterium S94]